MKTFLSTLVAFACVWNLSAQLITDFEGYTEGDQVIFRQPTFSGSTGGNLDATPNFSGVTNTFPAGNAGAGSSVCNSIFSFATTATTPWLRLTSFGAPNLPNPTILLSQGLTFDIYVDRPLYVALLVRETGTTADVGADGGAGGTIEFVGGVPTAETGKGFLVPANEWTTLAFNLATDPVSGFTGDGILDSATGKGTLEALGLSTDAGNSGVWNVYLDNFQVVPEPSTFALTLLGLSVLLIRRRS